MYIKNDSYNLGFNISIVEAHYAAKYMGEWCLKDIKGNWTEEPTAIFYVEHPDTFLGHTHYFALFRRGDSIMITRGDSAFECPIYVAVADDGEVIASRFRHDYVTSADSSVFIDGGRDYLRTGTNATPTMTVIDGKFYINTQEVIIKEESH